MHERKRDRKREGERERGRKRQREREGEKERETDLEVLKAGQHRGRPRVWHCLWVAGWALISKQPCHVCMHVSHGCSHLSG